MVRTFFQRRKLPECAAEKQRQLVERIDMNMRIGQYRHFFTLLLMLL